mmetsp:Transcript_101233/g.312177  ORF Transcript_101233/g.312177 Transcript_101233/m.312177 type:complete len:483 (-) Transcript_101233:87-1535(-)
MAIGAGAALRVRVEAEVRQAPSLSSPLLHVAQAGHLVKQLADAVDVPGSGRRVPLVPRGWIDEDAVELAEDGAVPRQPCAGAIAAAAGPPAGGPRHGAELLRLLGDGRQPRRKGGPPGEAADGGTVEAGTKPEDDRWQEGGGEGGSGGDWWASGSCWAESQGSAREDGSWQDLWQETGTQAGVSRDAWWRDGREENGAAREDGGWREERQRHAAAGTDAPRDDVWREGQQKGRGAHKDDAGGPEGSEDVIAAGVLFSGTVARQDADASDILLECPEARTVFGLGDITAPRSLLPPGAELGSSVCFALWGGAHGSPPQLVPGSVTAVGAPTARTAVLAGTVKSFSCRQTGERTGWVTSTATRQTYNSDVYVHGSMLQGLGLGDAVAFTVHENARGLPQASIGSVVRLGPKVQGGRDESTGTNLVEGMDALAYAPGRILFGEPTGDLFESLLSEARRDLPPPAGRKDTAALVGHEDDSGAFAYQ